MRYYWCVNCGYAHDFGKDRQRGLNCVNCGYDEVTEYDQEDWDEKHDKIVLRNKALLKDGRTFIGEENKKTKEEVDDILRRIREGTYVNSNG